MRYRQDEETRYTTVELVVDCKAVKAVPGEVVLLRVPAGDQQLGQQVEAAGGVWNPALAAWQLTRETAESLGVTAGGAPHAREAQADPAPITPKLRGWRCAEIPDVERWAPAGEAVLYWLALGIGKPDEQCSTLYYLCVATRAGLDSHDSLKNRPGRAGRAPPLLLQRYSWEAVVKGIQERLDASADTDWTRVRGKLRRYFD